MKIKLLSCLILVVLACNAGAQNVDSMIMELSKPHPDTTKINLRYKIGYNLMIFRLPYWDSILQDARKFKMQSIESGTLNCMGYIHDNNGNLDTAIEYYKQSMKIDSALNDKRAAASSCINIGYTYENMGKLITAIEYFDKGLKMCKELKDTTYIANVLNNLGFVYKQIDDMETCEKYWKECLALRKTQKNTSLLAQAYNNLGLLYDDTKRYDLAMTHYVKSLRLYESIPEDMGISYEYHNIGCLYYAQKKYPEALEYLKKSLELKRKINEVTTLSKTLCNLSLVAIELNDIDGAFKYAQEGYDYAARTKKPVLIAQASDMLRKVYFKKGNFEKAYFYMDLFKQMEDSVKNDDIKKVATKQQFKFEFEQKETALKIEQEKKEVVAREELKQQKLITYSSIGGGILVLLLFIFAYSGYRNKQKANTIILEQKEKVETQKHLIEEKQKEILDSINYAKRLQGAILPPEKLIKESLPENFVLYKPKDIVSGDFYWMENVGDLVLFAAADCTGHGVPGAMVSVVCSNALNRTVKEFGFTEPGKILDKVRQLVVETFEKSESEVKDGMDISICGLNRKTNELFWAGANNPLWIFKKNVGLIEEYKADKQPVGKVEEIKPFTTHSFKLEAGDAVYVFTDGYADQFGGPKGKKFKYKPFMELLLSVQERSMKDQRSILEHAIEEWRGNLEQVDDILVIGARL